MKIAFAGDWHGNHRYAKKAINYAAKNGADVIIQVGDFGVWSPHESFIGTVNRAADQYNLQVFFVDGNHEDHPWLNSQPVREDGFRVLHDNVAHIPRGTLWTWDGVNFLGLGGAHSVDRQWRRDGVEWFPEETLTYGQAFHAGTTPENIDVMITHDCPAGVEIPGISGNPHGFPKEEIALAEKHRELLGYVVDRLQPKILVHGHYHVSYSDMLDRTVIRGLDCDGRPLDKNIWLLDTEGLGNANGLAR